MGSVHLLSIFVFPGPWRRMGLTLDNGKTDCGEYDKCFMLMEAFGETEDTPMH